MGIHEFKKGCYKLLVCCDDESIVDFLYEGELDVEPGMSLDLYINGEVRVEDNIEYKVAVRVE